LSLIPLTFVRSADQLWLFYVVTFVQATLVQFFAPAENAMLPLLVDERHLVSANALNSLNNNLARLIGPAIGGLLLSAAGLSAVVLIDSATYWIAAVLILLISVTSRPIPTADPGSVSKLARDWRAGLRVIQTDPLLKLLFVCAAIMALGEGAVGVLFVPFVTDILRGEATFLGWLMSAQAVGGLIGGAVIGWIGPRSTPLRLFIAGALIFGTIDLIIFNFTASAPGLALLLFVIVGIPTVALGTGYDTLIQLRTVDAYRGRVFGAIQTVMALFAIIGTINLQGSNYVVVGLLMLFALRVGWVAARPVSAAPASATD
jgi:predicted MFS family arabinose efflux permease